MTKEEEKYLLNCCRSHPNVVVGALDTDETGVVETEDQITNVSPRMAVKTTHVVASTINGDIAADWFV